MRAVLALGRRLAFARGGDGRLSAVLVLAAVTLSSGLLAFAVSVDHAFGARADREAWRHPVAATGRATAVEALRSDVVRGQRLVIVDVAALGPDAPVPPGLTRFPRPGQVYVSPALAALLHDLPADRLAGRFPGPVTGRIGNAGLVHGQELVAVVGHAPDDPAMATPRAGAAAADAGGFDFVAPTRISGWATAGPEFGPPNEYVMLGRIATVLMLVPLLVFGGAAARLTVARRDRRLATLRLAGATPGQVVGLTVAEAVVTAFAGAVAGLALYAAAMPLLAHIPMMGGTWWVADLWPGPLWALAILLGVPVLVGLSAVVGLRRVVVSPLGVARRQTPPGLKAVRIVVALALVVAFPVVGRAFGAQAGVGILLALLGLAFLGLNLAGPWVVGVLGRIVAATASGPSRLLAGRRLVDDPRSAWRTVSGVALVGFVAGLLALFDVSGGAADRDGMRTLSVTVPAAQVRTVTADVKDRLREKEVTGTVGTGDAGRDGTRLVEVTSPSGTDLDRVRTALAGTVPGHTFTTPADGTVVQDELFGDVRTGVLIVLAVSFLVAMVSAGITGVSSVLDRRQAYALLRLAGTPLRVLDRARRQETLIPLAVMGGGSLAAGLLCGLPFAVSGLFRPYGLLMLGGFVAVGLAGVVGATALSRPLLRAVTRSPRPQFD